MADVTQEKVVEYIKGISVMELSELVKTLEEELGVSAAMPVAMPGAAGAAAGVAAGAAAAAPVPVAGSAGTAVPKNALYM